MKVYKCAISGDEMFSDAFPIVEENGFYKVKAKYVVRSGGVYVDIGANPSAEGGDEEDACEDADAERGLNVVLDNRLVETGFGTKKEYQTWMKAYIKLLFEKKGLSGEEFDKAKDETQGAFKFACGKFKDLSFFKGESMNDDAHICCVDWVEEEVNGKTESIAYMYFYKHGMIVEKV